MYYNIGRYLVGVLNKLMLPLHVISKVVQGLITASLLGAEVPRSIHYTYIIHYTLYIIPAYMPILLFYLNLISATMIVNAGNSTFFPMSVKSHIIHSLCGICFYHPWLAPHTLALLSGRPQNVVITGRRAVPGIGKM